MNKTANEILLEEQEYWVKKTLKEYWCDTILKESNGKLCADKDKILSHPFYLGLTDEYIIRPDGKKRIMIVGQEPMGYGSICDGTARYDFIKSCTAQDCEKDTNESKNSQQWAIAYLIKQLYGEDAYLPECYNKKIKYNSSPFWNIFRLLKDEYVLCWNNLDKVYFVETGELTYGAEKKLSECYVKEGEVEKRSLLQREIKLAEPDLVLFVTGPKYNVSMNVAFGLKDELDSVKPSSNKKLIPITDIAKLTSNTKSEYIPAFWTYHPNYLSHNKVLNEIINEIKGVKL